MFCHQHPYPPFLFSNTEKVIVGTLPPPRFSTGDLKPDDVNFCYGSRDGQLWPILDRIFDLKLSFEDTEEAVAHRKEFLRAHKLGICDIVETAYREKIDASDLGMQKVVLRDLVEILERYPSVHTLLFTGGNSKNGPEYFFRRHLKQYNVKLALIDSEVPRIHEFRLPKSDRLIRTVSLTAPSGAANRAVGSMSAYKRLKKEHPKINTVDFRVLQYRNHFL
ncbi:MAG: DNA glycosylase [Flavobacteriaceae bacterium]|nr:DNA glycosylase [Flavobacteriaceae bacterium]